jgi:hypothetical protein
VWVGLVAVPTVLAVVFGWPLVFLVSLLASCTAILRTPDRPRRRRIGIVAAGVGIVLLLTPVLIGVGALAAGVL